MSKIATDDIEQNNYDSATTIHGSSFYTLAFKLLDFKLFKPRKLLKAFAVDEESELLK